jgi:hypothetical protein
MAVKQYSEKFKMAIEKKAIILSDEAVSYRIQVYATLTSILNAMIFMLQRTVKTKET